MNTIHIMVLRPTMLNIIQFIRTTEATMKRWEFHKVKSKAMAKGNSFYMQCVCALESMVYAVSLCASIL